MSFGDKQNRMQTPFIPNSKLVFTLPLGGKVLKGNVILTGAITVAGGTVNGVQYGEGGPINLIKRVIVTATPANGSRYPGGKIVDDSPRALTRYAIMQHNGKFISEQSGSTLGNGANGVYPIYLSIPIYWADSTLRNNVATALNTDPGTYASVQVEIDTADLTNCFTGNNGVVTWGGLTVQWADERVALPGDTVVRFSEDHVFLIAAGQKRALDQAMPQDGAFESWLIMAEQSPALTLSDALLNKVDVNGNPIIFSKYAQDIRQQMLDDEWIDPAQPATGLYFIDWTDSVLQNTITAGTLQTRFDVNNVSGANNDDLLIMTRRVFAPAPANS
jgi:hypothetical protein